MTKDPQLQQSQTYTLKSCYTTIKGHVLTILQFLSSEENFLFSIFKRTDGLLLFPLTIYYADSNILRYSHHYYFNFPSTASEHQTSQ